jgi:hypothetical protein
MSQNNLVIDNQSFPTTRADISSALQALGSLNSGSSAPTTTYANMLWYDTSANTLKMRSEANDQWINIGYLDQSADAFRIFDDTQVVDSSGTQTGLVGDQSTSTWEAGTSTTESLVSPAKVKAASAGDYSLSTNGYQKLPSGLIMQWGQVTGVNQGSLKTVSFPTSFSSEVYSINVTPKDYRTSNDFEVDLYSVAAISTSLTQFTIIQEGTSSGNNQTMYFQALGV